jgi:hypothetical protein
MAMAIDISGLLFTVRIMPLSMATMEMVINRKKTPPPPSPTS